MGAGDQGERDLYNKKKLQTAGGINSYFQNQAGNNSPLNDMLYLFHSSPVYC